jgi:hypothetical protein
MHQKRKKPLPFNWKFLTNSKPRLSPFHRSEVQTIINNLKFPRLRPHHGQNSAGITFSWHHIPHTELETKQYCTTAFLDICKTFDKVWHTRLLHKLGHFLPLNYYHILKSYLHNRHFQVKVEDSYTDPLSVNTGMTQGSVLGPLLYLLYTADLPTSPDSTTASISNIKILDHQTTGD